MTAQRSAHCSLRRPTFFVQPTSTYSKRYEQLNNDNSRLGHGVCTHAHSRSRSRSIATAHAHEFEARRLACACNCNVLALDRELPHGSCCTDMIEAIVCMQSDVRLSMSRSSAEGMRCEEEGRLGWQKAGACVGCARECIRRRCCPFCCVCALCVACVYALLASLS